MKSWWPLFALLSVLPLSAGGDAPGIVRMETPLQVEAAYERVYKALEQARFWVVHEVDLGERMAHQAEAWGANYNRNRVGGVRVLAFGNLEWANALANADPDLFALYPLHLAVYERDGTSVLVLPRLAAAARGTAGESRARELDAEVRRILEDALADPGPGPRSPDR